MNDQTHCPRCGGVVQYGDVCRCATPLPDNAETLQKAEVENRLEEELMNARNMADALAGALMGEYPAQIALDKWAGELDLGVASNRNVLDRIKSGYFAIPRVEDIFDAYQKEIKRLKDRITTLESDLKASMEKHRELQETITCIEHEVAKVYCHITDNKISKPNTLAEHVIAEADECYESQFTALHATSCEALKESEASCAVMREVILGLEIKDEFFDTEKCVWILLRTDGVKIGAGSIRVDGAFGEALKLYSEKRRAALSTSEGKGDKNEPSKES